jgi:UDP-glucose 4-epimerase
VDAKPLLQTYEKRAVAVTGGLGFIGSNLARSLVDLGCSRVVVFDSLDPEAGGSADNLDGVAGIELHRIDIGNTERARPLLEGVDVVFNLAGRTSHVASMRSPALDLHANCAAQLGFLEACRRSGPPLRLVFTSTRQVYGAPKELPVAESHPLDPPDINAVHKLAAESYHRIHARTTGAEVVCLRLTNVYGPRQSLQGALLGFFPTFLSRALRNEPIELFDAGRVRRDLLFVDDVVDALLRAGASPAAAGQIFNVGCDQGFTLREVAERLIALAGGGRVVDVPLPKERHSVDIGDYLTDPRHIAGVLGWKAATPLEEGLARTVAFYSTNRARFAG